MRTFGIISVIGLLLSTGANATSFPSAESLLTNWKNAIYTDQEHSELVLSLIEPGSDPVDRKAELWHKSSEPGSHKFLMRFKSPASLRGVAFLSLRRPGQTGADQWLYFPSYGKARRLSSHGRDEPFLDSDFTNGDISFDYEDAFDFSVTREATVAGQLVYVVEGTVKPGKMGSLPYSKEVLFITKKDSLNLRTEFYGLNGVLVKTLVVSGWRRLKKQWTADSLEVETLKSRHRSVIRLVSRNVDEAPADSKFTQNELERGR